MITSHEIAIVFGIMEASYGHLWRQDEGAVEVWFKKLNKYTPTALRRAAENSLNTHPDHPPTLPQFDALCYALSEPDYKSLPPPVRTKEQINAQRAMLRVVFSVGGVSKPLLKRMVQLKNALVEDADQYGENFFSEVEQQLLALVGDDDRNA